MFQKDTFKSVRGARACSPTPGLAGYGTCLSHPIGPDL